MLSKENMNKRVIIGISVLILISIFVFYLMIVKNADPSLINPVVATSILTDDCISQGGEIRSRPPGLNYSEEFICPDNMTSLGRVYDVDCICLCCKP